MPFKLSDYPKNWKDIATKTKTDFDWRCALCRANHNPHIFQHRLTVHHIDENPQNNAPENLVALCSACHLSIEHEARRAVLNRGRQLEFFPENTYWAAMDRLRQEGLNFS